MQSPYMVLGASQNSSQYHPNGVLKNPQPLQVFNLRSYCFLIQNSTKPLSQTFAFPMNLFMKLPIKLNLGRAGVAQ